MGRRHRSYEALARRRWRSSTIYAYSFTASSGVPQEIAFSDTAEFYAAEQQLQQQQQHWFECFSPNHSMQMQQKQQQQQWFERVGQQPEFCQQQKQVEKVVKHAGNIAGEERNYHGMNKKEIPTENEHEIDSELNAYLEEYIRGKNEVELQKVLSQIQTLLAKALGQATQEGVAERTERYVGTAECMADSSDEHMEEEYENGEALEDMTADSSDEQKEEEYENGEVWEAMVDTPADEPNEEECECLAQPPPASSVRPAVDAMRLQQFREYRAVYGPEARVCILCPKPTYIHEPYDECCEFCYHELLPVLDPAIVRTKKAELRAMLEVSS